MAAPRIAIGPNSSRFGEDAVRAGGGLPLKLGERADGLVWLSAHDLDGLGAVLEDQPEISWVQLPFAGIENWPSSGASSTTPGMWTCAKGSYADAVAEHALMLALAGLRLLPGPHPGPQWGAPAGASLYGASVTILGGGGITQELLRLLAPFGVEATVVRRQAEPVRGRGAHRDDRGICTGPSPARWSCSWLWR